MTERPAGGTPASRADRSPTVDGRAARRRFVRKTTGGVIPPLVAVALSAGFPFAAKQAWVSLTVLAITLVVAAGLLVAVVTERRQSWNNKVRAIADDVWLEVVSEHRGDGGWGPPGGR